jgi:hypothetical protein
MVIKRSIDFLMGYRIFWHTHRMLCVHSLQAGYYQEMTSVEYKDICELGHRISVVYDFVAQQVEELKRR